MPDERDKPPPSEPTLASLKSPVHARRDLNDRGLHGQVRSLGGRVGVVEQRIGHAEGRIEHLEAPPGRPTVPRPAPASPPPASSRDAELAARVRQSEASHEQAKELAAVVRHFDKAFGAVLDNDDRQDKAQARQAEVLEAHSRALVLLGRELGLEDKLDPLLTKSLPPPPPGASSTPATPVLRRLDRRSQAAQIVQAIIALGIIFDFLRSVFFHH